jgi:hypothetical protein
MVVMDEMKLNLGTRFMRKIAAKLLVKFVKKQLGVNIQLDLNELKFTYLNGDVVIKTDLELKMDKIEAKKLLKQLDEDEELF